MKSTRLYLILFRYIDSFRLSHSQRKCLHLAINCLKIRSQFPGLKEDVSKVFSFCDVGCRVLTVERYKSFCDPAFITC